MKNKTKVSYYISKESQRSLFEHYLERLKYNQKVKKSDLIEESITLLCQKSIPMHETYGEEK